MSDKGNDRIVCPGERPHNKRSGQGIVRKPNCERVLAFTSDLNEIEDLTIPCSGCGRLIRIKQSPEKGVVLEVLPKGTKIDSFDSVKVVLDER